MGKKLFKRRKPKGPLYTPVPVNALAARVTSSKRPSASKQRLRERLKQLKSRLESCNDLESAKKLRRAIEKMRYERAHSLLAEDKRLVSEAAERRARKALERARWLRESR
jgi:hypothetical protein